MQTKAQLVEQVKAAAELKGIDWSKIQEFINNLALPILAMLLEYLKRNAPMMGVNEDGSCDHACCCGEYIQMAQCCLACAKEHCECCKNKE